MNIILLGAIIWIGIMLFLIYGYLKETKKFSIKEYIFNKKQSFKEKLAGEISKKFFSIGGGSITKDEASNLQKNYFGFLRKAQNTIWIMSLAISLFIIFPLFDVTNEKILLVINFMILSYVILLPKSIKKELNNR